ncbi:MAG: deoxyribonuclease V [Gloeomargaritaceae cyanobacterium C42_A2020_066]|nr:deoxyribonuclease V [Gloeomargaritaceae cyanobacterium C42_A2020_066]
MGLPDNWPQTPQAAIALQRELASQVVTEDDLGPIHWVAGVDVGFECQNTVARAAVAVLRYPTLERVAQQIARRPAEFPYRPGLLSFRELPVILAALENLKPWPDVFLCDGQGLAHPRRFGIACHLGVMLNRPAVGVAKTRLVGRHTEVPDQRGAWVPLLDQGETLGAVLRTRPGTRPLYISVGHRVSLETALELVMACTGRYRLPETTRQAHRLASGPADIPEV